MASQALGIVRRILANDVYVRIVARHATNPRIGAVEALAVGEAAWLEANGRFAAPVISHHRLPRAVTLAAKSTSGDYETAARELELLVKTIRTGSSRTSNWQLCTIAFIVPRTEPRSA